MQTEMNNQKEFNSYVNFVLEYVRQGKIKADRIMVEPDCLLLVNSIKDNNKHSYYIGGFSLISADVLLRYCNYVSTNNNENSKMAVWIYNIIQNKLCITQQVDYRQFILLKDSTLPHGTTLADILELYYLKHFSSSTTCNKYLPRYNDCPKGIKYPFS